MYFDQCDVVLSLAIGKIKTEIGSIGEDLISELYQLILSAVLSKLSQLDKTSMIFLKAKPNFVIRHICSVSTYLNEQKPNVPRYYLCIER